MENMEGVEEVSKGVSIEEVAALLVALQQARNVFAGAQAKVSDAAASLGLARAERDQAKLEMDTAERQYYAIAEAVMVPTRKRRGPDKGPRRRQAGGGLPEQGEQQAPPSDAEPEAVAE